MDDYWTWWKSIHPLRDQTLPLYDQKRKSILESGCVGVTCLNLGVNQPLFGNCFRKRAEAEVRQREMIEKKECNGENCDREKAQPKLFSIHLQNDIGKDRIHPDVQFVYDLQTGKSRADLSNWDQEGLGDKIRFDFGFVHTSGEIIHANHFHDPNGDYGPMTVSFSTPEEWARMPSIFNLEVWCVACDKDRIALKRK